MRIAAVTVARSDYGIYRPVWRAIRDDPEMELQVVAAAAHLEQRFGRSVDQIRNDGFEIAAEVPMLESSDDAPLAQAESYGKGVGRFAEALQQLGPDLVLLLGDRSEMHAAACAAVLLGLPIAHIHGGEESAGAIDNQWRHSITKLAVLHFASTDSAVERIVQMGEDPRWVFRSGAPALDEILNNPAPSFERLQAVTGPLESGFVLITLHPATATQEDPVAVTRAIAAALQESQRSALWTMPNADSGGNLIRAELARIQDPRIRQVENLGPDLYRTAMEHAGAMVGNSSSGIIEAASYKLPVLNIGDRQKGRDSAGNVIHVPAEATRIRAGLQEVLDPQFRARLEGLVNPYGAGNAAATIVTGINAWKAAGMPKVKQFWLRTKPEPR